MELWSNWWELALTLRAAFSRGITFVFPCALSFMRVSPAPIATKKTLIDKAGSMLVDVFGEHQEFPLLADAYYANGKMFRSLFAHGSILISRVRTNAVAYEKADNPTRKKRGRPKLYGTKIKLADLFFSAIFTKLTCKLYAENVQVEYLCKDLIWKPFGKFIRFVLVKHQKKGHVILMSSDLSSYFVGNGALRHSRPRLTSYFVGNSKVAIFSTTFWDFDTTHWRRTV